MQHIVIVCGESSAMLYVSEAIDRGYIPIIVDPPIISDPHIESFKKTVDNSTILIKAKDMDNQDDVVEELKKYDIACIVPGAAGGVRYAEKLIDRMGFKGNGYDSLWRRETKYGMAQSLKEAGLRHIRTAKIEKEEDITDFFERNNLTCAFVKYNESAASVGSKKCNSPQEAIDFYRTIKDGVNVFGWKTDIIIQEFIEGTEYIVNTVSCEGVHMVTDVWVYKKVFINDFALYKSCELIMKLEPGMHDLILYAYKVLDATGFKYGPCHSEFKIDENGPVLIETNPRPMGASLTADYLNYALGHHVTDIALDSYLNKTSFMMRRKRPYRPLRKAIIKFLYAPKDMDVNMSPFLELLKCLKSFKSTNPEIEDKIIHISETKDLDTCPLFIKLCHSDSEVVCNEADFLHNIEVNYFNLLYSLNEKIPATVIHEDVKWIYDYVPHNIKILFCTDKGKFVYHMQKETTVVDTDWELYDMVVIADTREGTLGDKIAMLRREASQLNSGGYIVILPEFYEKFPYKAVAIEIILHILDFTVNVPPMESEGNIVANKN